MNVKNKIPLTYRAAKQPREDPTEIRVYPAQRRV